MKEIVLTIFACLFLSAAICAQTPASAAQTKPEKDDAQKAEFAEANRLYADSIALQREGKFNEALEAAKRSVEIKKKLLSADDVSFASSLFQLAKVQMAVNNFGDAKDLIQKALNIYEKSPEKNGRQIVTLLDTLAFTEYALGNPVKTESLYQRALAAREKAYGAEHAEVAAALFRLAEFYQVRGNYEKAEPLYAQAAAIFEKNADTNRSNLGQVLIRYACAERKLKKEGEAIQLEGRASAFLSPDVSASKTVNGGVVNGKALSLPKPIYPAEARARRESGLVTVRVHIDESGKVLAACAVEGPLLLRQASEQAAYNAKFTLTMLMGQPVKVTGEITYRFMGQ